MHPSFGPIIASLRKNHFELTTGRTWSQKTVAERIGVSPRLIENIEQGEKQHIDKEILGKLADAFQLTTLERREFFALAVDVSSQQLMPNPPPPDAILPPLLEMVRRLRQPAYLHDNLFNIIALNGLLLAFFNVADHDVTHLKNRVGTNYLHVLFAKSSPIRSLLSRHWHSLALRAVYRFRALSLRYRHTASFQALFDQLCHLPDFKAIWLQTQHDSQDFYSQLDLDEYTHALWGQLQYILTRTTTVTTYGNLYLVTLAPACVQSATTFSTLAVQPGMVKQLAHWPNPDLAAN